MPSEADISIALRAGRTRIQDFEAEDVDLDWEEEAEETVKHQKSDSRRRQRIDVTGWGNSPCRPIMLLSKYLQLAICSWVERDQLPGPGLKSNCVLKVD